VTARDGSWPLVTADGGSWWVVAAREQGMSFGAYFTDTGCVDRHYVQHNLEARQMGVPYSGERILADCWAEQLVTST
jgi:hypothetical protein